MHDLFIISAFKDDCIEYPPEKPKIKVLTLTVKSQNLRISSYRENLFLVVFMLKLNIIFLLS